MTICREWLLLQESPTLRRARPLYCRSWRCDFCNPKRRSQLIAQAISGAPERFITLTAAPQAGLTPIDRLQTLQRAWKVVVQRLRRQHPEAEIEYLVTVEETKAGEPHLHILARCPYLPQTVLSDWMRELANSPICDIRRVRGAKQTVQYVAKYIGKAPAQFGSAKRYWQSRHYAAPWEPQEDDAFANLGAFRVWKEGVENLFRAWMLDGFIGRRDGAEGYIAFGPDFPQGLSS